ncbi:AAA family ATPase [Glaciimonas immobilis]|uniref:Pilus assembly protein CpaE n=1 Tax=Glaciimonas immobilis TaxID=728004 RepID=A0A840RMM1_9BURK|nr:pilus assembly protein CpaE [Glaciimonas immobilis]KAF3998824.1 pilus assembly protein CpaE [Glaciimonas immobilis]MBB5198208.1 pilus assembly protein CpaE [Glaciimonas immobilis]
MNAPIALNEITTLSRFVLCSENNQQAEWLGHALEKWGTLWQEHSDVATLLPRIIDRKPLLVLLDFSGFGSAERSVIPHSDECIAAIARAVELAHALKSAAPDLPLVAIGSMAFPEGAIAAWRAGLSDFVDISAPSEEAHEVIQRVLSKAIVPSPVVLKRGQLVTLVGARPGVGASTLSAHLADLFQRRVQNRSGDKSAAISSRVALLDLGLPAGDGKLYLTTNGNFDFAEAVRNLRRLDETLVHTALSRSPGGVTVISLPFNLSEMRTVSHHDALALLDQLRTYFDVLIADLGGFSNQEFITNITGASDHVWLLTDQSVGALVSLADTVKVLGEVPAGERKRQLVVNRYDERFGMSAQQIAERFGLPLLAVLPERTRKLFASANLGKLLHEVAPQDGYVRTVEGLIDHLITPHAAPPRRQGIKRWIMTLLQRK